jgi:hypothetical protein
VGMDVRDCHSCRLAAAILPGCGHAGAPTPWLDTVRRGRPRCGGTTAGSSSGGTARHAGASPDQESPYRQSTVNKSGRASTSGSSARKCAPPRTVTGYPASLTVTVAFANTCGRFTRTPVPAAPPQQPPPYRRRRSAARYTRQRAAGEQPGHRTRLPAAARQAQQVLPCGDGPRIASHRDRRSRIQLQPSSSAFRSSRTFSIASRRKDRNWSCSVP